MTQDKIECILGDITTVSVDAIVNAANNSLMGGGGVDGAIHRAGGPAILEECRKIVEQQGGCRTGEAVITTAGNLPSNHVIHTVGPVWRSGDYNEEQLLANCYQNSLQVALENQIETIAFPNISTGIYGFPKDKAAVISVKTIQKVLNSSPNLKKVLIVSFDEENYQEVTQQLTR